MHVKEFLIKKLLLSAIIIMGLKGGWENSIDSRYICFVKSRQINIDSFILWRHVAKDRLREKLHDLSSSVNIHALSSSNNFTSISCATGWNYVSTITDIANNQPLSWTLCLTSMCASQREARENMNNFICLIITKTHTKNDKFVHFKTKERKKRQSDAKRKIS